MQKSLFSFITILSILSVLTGCKENSTKFVEFEIKKIENLLLSDEQIIMLRANILKSSDAQLKNGVITSSEYIVELTNLFEAKSISKTHEVQLAAAKADYEIIKGK